MSKITMIKKDAIVSIKVSAAFLQRLQKVMFSIAFDKTPEEMLNFREQADKIRSEQNYIPEFTEEWMNEMFTMSILINEIESTLIKEGHTYEEEIEDPILPDSLLPDQSQSQPE